MNLKKLGNILGKIMLLESILMAAPLLISLVYREGWRNFLAFFIPMGLLAGLGLLLQLPRPKRNRLYQREGFALTALVWVVMALFGALPFVINGEIPNYIDAFFEIMSGLTTTGASLVEDVAVLSHSTLFWRSFSHWIGGMGVLAFVLIFIPESDDGSSMHLLRAESPGPQVGKLVSKMKVTTRILYLIYLSMTALEFIFLCCGPLLDVSALAEAIGAEAAAAYGDDKVFHAALTAFGCAGTGGFGSVPGSMQYFTPYAQYVASAFLILFGCNFALYYLLLIGKVGQALKSRELRSYLMIIAVGVGLVALSLAARFENFPQDYSGEEIFRHSLFQVVSLITTAGFATTDYNLWPMAAISMLIIVMFCGSMAGSTSGGMKLSRILIAIKGAYINVRRLINPHYVPKAKLEGKPLEEKTIGDVFAFITMYFFILFGTVLLLSLDPINGQEVPMIADGGEYTVPHGFFSNFSASLACISNVGPAFEAMGPYASYAGYSAFSKIILSLTMLMGRLEILPVLILFTPKTWKRV